MIEFFYPINTIYYTTDINIPDFFIKIFVAKTVKCYNKLIKNILNFKTKSYPIT